MGFIRRRWFLLLLLIGLGVYAYINYLRPVYVHESMDKESIHYINDIYYANGNAYEKLLNKGQKDMYKDILEALKVNKTEFKIYGDKYSCDVYATCEDPLAVVMDAIVLDHPELISLGNYEWVVIDDHIKIQFRYLVKGKLWTDLEEMRLLRVMADMKKKTTDMTEMEIIKYVYEYTGRATFINNQDSNSNDKSAYSIFKKKKSLSPAYAKVSQILFQYFGIESYLVMGETTYSHMWNIIKIDGEYYYFDATMTASFSKDNAAYYEGIGPDPIDYKMSYSSLYPNVSTTKYGGTK